MQISPEITFLHMDPSPALEDNIRQRVAKLDEFYDRIIGCRVAVEGRHKHHHKGNLYRVRVELSVPGTHLVASHAPDQHHAYEDVYVAVRDAFAAVTRQLEDYARERRQDVKAHAIPDHGRVLRLDPARDCGFIGTPDGREVYFHRNSVVGARFEALEEGSEVRFVEEAGEQGPQASTVHVVGKHHIAG
jgi:ribosomal subunit interface protein